MENGQTLDELPDNLDPVNYLPQPSTLNDTIPHTAQNLAADLLVEAGTHPDFGGYRRSALAGGALYVSNTALFGPTVRQDDIADMTGTSPLSIRARMRDLARLALDDLPINEYAAEAGVCPSLTYDRLEHISVGRSVRTMPGESWAPHAPDKGALSSL